MNSLPLSCLYETWNDAVGLEPHFGSGSEAHLAEDDHLSQRLLRMVVGGWNPWDAKKGEEVFVLRADEIGSEGFGRLETKGLPSVPIIVRHLPIEKLDYMKRAAPRCDITHLNQKKFPKGGAAHEKDSSCRNRLPSKYIDHRCICPRQKENSGNHSHQE